MKQNTRNAGRKAKPYPQKKIQTKVPTKIHDDCKIILKEARIHFELYGSEENTETIIKNVPYAIYDLCLSLIDAEVLRYKLKK